MPQPAGSGVERSRGRRHRTDDQGTITAFVVIFVLALLLVAGLVLDGGLALSDQVQAIDQAQAAARAGAQAIDLTTYRATGAIVLDPMAAREAAERFLLATGHTGTVHVTGDEVSVTVSITRQTQILDVAGIDTMTVVGHGSARAEQAAPA